MDAAADKDASTASRLAVIMLFSICGGAIGGAFLVLVLLLFQPAALPSLPLLLIVAAGWGGVVGFIPAALTGVIYAFVPRRFQQVVFAPIIGAATSTGYAALLFRPALGQLSDITPTIGWFAAAGAGAALVCALIARKFRIDATGQFGGA
jgi:hypothetical protein